MGRLLLVAFEGSEAVVGVGFAQALQLPYDVLVLSGAAAPETLGCGKLMLGDLEPWPPADALAAGIAGVCAGYSHVAALSSMRSKDVMARVAGVLDAAAVTDVIAIESSTIFKRPVYAGAAIATVEVLCEPVVVTFRSSGFPSSECSGAPDIARITIPIAGNVRIVSTSQRGTSRPDLAQARVVVSGGRPLKDAETFERIIGGLADALGGAVGATRAAVDSGIAPNELQVGQTGKVVAPDLYIAAGISGSTQHMAGIKDSKVIVAINKDPDAPIFEAADLGLVADLYDAVPELTLRLKSSL